MRLLKIVACAALLAACAREPEGTWAQDGASVSVTAASGKRVRLEMRTDRIVRVTSQVSGDFDLPQSLMVVDSKIEPPKFEARKSGDQVELDTGKIVARVSLTNGAVSFTDQSGKALLAEVPGAAPAQGVSQRFNAGTDEGLYRLGPTPERAARPERRGRRARAAQHGHRGAVRGLDAQLRRAVGQQRHHAHRRPETVRSRVARPQGARRGRQGGRLHGTYSIAGEKKLERVEKDINYQYIRDRFNWPKEMLTGQEPVAGAPPNILPNQSVTWEGALVSEKSGVHKFQLYGSSYFKVWVNGKLMLDRWRQNWAAWYQNFEVPMVAGTPLKVQDRVDPRTAATSRCCTTIRCRTRSAIR